MNFLSVKEILALNLPLLPKTKPPLLAKAKREGWKSTERAGNGGITMFFEVPAFYFEQGKEGEKITLFDAKAAAGKAFEAATIAGMTDKDKFIQMFELFCETHKEEPRQSLSHNARRAKAGKHSNIITGDSNIQIVKKGKDNGK